MAEQLKNMFDITFVVRLAQEMANVDANFKQTVFIENVLANDWDTLELKARANKLAVQLAENLPYKYQRQLEIIQEVAPNFSGFQGIIFPTMVELYGIDFPNESLAALKELTPYSTSEFAIRPFIVKYPSTLKTMLLWSADKNHHVRRLASEGCRPLLPWAMKLNQLVEDPGAILPIIANLKNDSEDYVYRSVANNLNDISKHHPELVITLCEDWIHESKTTKWVAKHALRSLLKAGNQRAMRLFGFGSIAHISLTDFTVADQEIEIGDSTRFSFSLKHLGKPSKFRLEYAISYLKKNGTHNEKVFQIKEKLLQTNEVITIEKKMDFKNLSTRKHYPGTHFITLKINGIPHEKIEFNLL